jgi:hypothetical protein
MEINYYLLQRMGWNNDHFDRDLMYAWWSYLPNDLTKNSSVLSFIYHDDILYSLIGFSSEEKLTKKVKYNKYQFVKLKIGDKKVKYNKYQFVKLKIGDKKSSQKFSILKKENVCSFIQLLSLIKENLACNLTYKRLFQINSITK